METGRLETGLLEAGRLETGLLETGRLETGLSVGNRSVVNMLNLHPDETIKGFRAVSAKLGIMFSHMRQREVNS